MSKSTHAVEVVPVVLTPHPNADSLSIVRVHDAYQAIVRTADWQDRALGAYAPPDSVIPPGLVPGIEGRVRAIRLRGLISEGLLISAPDGAQVGDDVAEVLGIGHYEPPLNASTGGEAAPAPSGYVPTYDVEAARRYGSAFVVGERVISTEKIHGANGRWTFRDGVMHAGSRTEWKQRTDERGRQILWWAALDAHPEISAWCEAHPRDVLFGEVYGQVQDLKYGRNDAQIALFDVFRDGAFMSHDAAREAGAGLPWVPVLYDGPFTTVDELGQHAEGRSMMPGADHVREGCVVRPERERSHEKAGRVVLKLIGRDYLTRKGA